MLVVGVAVFVLERFVCVDVCVLVSEEANGSGDHQCSRRDD